MRRLLGAMMRRLSGAKLSVEVYGCCGSHSVTAADGIYV
jgi:hypothetical protein